MKVAQQHALPVADQTGPILLLTQSAGTNRSTGSSEYMDGAQVINREIADLTRGNGPHQGYVTQIKGADTSVTRWQGNASRRLRWGVRRPGLDPHVVHVRLPQIAPGGLDHRAQHRIALDVPQPVVDCLESVQVEEHHGERTPETPGASDLESRRM
jgi:hypothetical protein